MNDRIGMLNDPLELCARALEMKYSIFPNTIRTFPKISNVQQNNLSPSKLTARCDCAMIKITYSCSLGGKLCQFKS